MSALPSPASRPPGTVDSTDHAHARAHAPRGRAAARTRPDLRVVTPPGYGTRYVVALLLLAAVGVFGAVSLSALAAESAFQARALEADVDALSARYDELTYEVASLRSPDRVQSVAVEELGMVPAEQPAYVLLDPDGEGVGAASAPAGLLAAGEMADPLKSVLGSGR